ncbi:MAG: response regulator transcription factor [Flavobacteriales bacterium]|nr:response regulator transcription factor [Flavobacteriales bacterium]
MKILIIDDEPRARNLLHNIIDQQCEMVEEVIEAANLINGVQAIKTQKPQLVFLDIEMPNQQGIEIFNYFQKEEIDFELVFTTAYSEYAIRAFEMNAVDYILKPIRPKRIKEVVAKVQESYNQESIQNKLEELKLSLSTNVFKKIGLPVSDGILFIPIPEIIHLEADGMYTKVYTLNNGSEIISKPLKFFENLVETNSSFYRPHRSHIFNLKYLKQFVRRDGNYVVLENDQIIPISKDKKEEFLELVSAL